MSTCRKLVRVGNLWDFCATELAADGSCPNWSNHLAEAPEAPGGVTWAELEDLEEGLK